MTDPVIDRAARILAAAWDDDYCIANKLVNKLGHEYGAGGLIQVMVAWVDTAFATIGKADEYTTEGKGPGDRPPFQLSWLNTDTGKINYCADDVSPEARWTGRLFAARYADDPEQFEALVMCLADYSPVVAGAHIETLLNSVVLMCKAGQALGLRKK